MVLKLLAKRGLGLLGKKSVTGLQHPVLDRLKIKKKYTDRVSSLNDKLEKKLSKLND